MRRPTPQAAAGVLALLAILLALPQAARAPRASARAQAAPLPMHLHAAQHVRCRGPPVSRRRLSRGLQHLRVGHRPI